MARRTDIADFVKGQIYSLNFHAHFSYSKIARVLGISRNTVKQYIHRVNNGRAAFGSNRQNCGIKRFTTPEFDNHARDISLHDRFKSAQDIRRELQNECNVSSRTISRRLFQCGLKPRKPALKPFLTDANKLRRLHWARSHINWSMNKWKNVAFSDESCFTLSEGRIQYVRRRKGERYSKQCVLKKLNRSTGNIKVWGAMSWFGFTPLFRITGNLNSGKYIDILRDNLVNNNYLLSNRPGFIYQNDNSPIHTSRNVKLFFQQNRIDTLEWPAFSPDINCIENVWGLMKSKLQKIKPHPNNINQLWDHINRIWNEIMTDTALRRSYISSMNKRVYAVYAAGGNFTKF